jgi:hypothetical protein
MGWKTLGAVLLLPFLAMGCEGSDPRDAEIIRLKTELQEVKAAAAIPVVAPVPPPAPQPKFLLVVSWPAKGGNDLRQPYAALDTCEEAKRAILQDAANERDETRARREREAEANGVRIIMGSEAPAPNATCLPL